MSELRAQFLLLLSAAIVLTLLALLVWQFGPVAIEHYVYRGVGLGLAANLIQILYVLVPVIIIFSILCINLPVTLGRWLRRRYWPPVGLGVLDARQLGVVVDGLKGQKERMAEKSWPMHEARAQLARTPTRIHLGDAEFSLPKSDRRHIRRFVGRSRRVLGTSALKDHILIVTGEPGAGKSVVGQEIHASLAEGVVKRHHAYIPLLLFASDLTAKLLSLGEAEVPTLRPFLIAYFHGFGTDRYARFANFLDTSWDDYDFLIVIDGLDEIAQRSVYEEIQWRLRDMIEAETARAKRSRRFILSCRLDDNIGVFGEADSIVMRGLGTELERNRFCANLVATYDLHPARRASIKAALAKHSSSLSSVDIFRRNPYFLSMLLIYFKGGEHDQIDRPIDFDFLIRDYMERDVLRGHAYAAGGPEVGHLNRRQLHNLLEPCASIFLQYLAYHMTSVGEEDALYGQAAIAADLVDGFVHSASRGDAERMTGIWPGVIALVARLAEGRAFDDTELGQWISKTGLDQNDLRIFAAIAPDAGIAPADAATRAADNSADEVMRAFSIIALEGRLEDTSWYRKLAAAIAAAGAGAFGEPRGRMATLLMARGLAAAHLLRLVYVEQNAVGWTVRFRHRRLAEYYAAAYFRDRWETLQPLPNSPWLTPVLNLVAAIEGPRCYAFLLFVDRIAHRDDGSVFARRADITSAAEISAFANRSSVFVEGLGALLTLLFDSLHSERAKQLSEKNDGSEAPHPGERRSFSTEMTLINAVDFIAGLQPGRFAMKGNQYAQFFTRENGQPSHLLFYSGRIGHAVASLAQQRRPLSFRLGSIWKALRDPNVLIDAPHEAFDNGLGLEWSMTFAWVLLVEFAAAIGVGALAQFVVHQAQPPGTPEGTTMALTVAAVLMILWSIWRLLVWHRSATQAALLARTPLGIIFYSLAAAAWVVLITLWSVIKAPSVLLQAWRYFARAFNRDRRKAASQAVRNILPLLLRAAAWCLLAIAGMAVVVYLATDNTPRDVKVEASESPLAPAANEMAAVKPNETRTPLPSTLPSGQEAELSCPASDNLLRYRRVGDTRSETIVAARRDVTRLYRAVKREWKTKPCARKFPRSNKSTALPLDLLDELLARDPLLIPLPEGQAPRFVRRDFAALRAAGDPLAINSSLEGPIAGLTAVVDASRLAEQRSRYAELFNALWLARGEGRISNSAHGYPVGAAYVGLGRDAENLIKDYPSRLAAFERRKAELHAQAIRTLLWWSVLLPAILALLLLAFGFRASRKDKATVACLGSASVKQICDALAANAYSDRVRQQLKQVLRDRQNLTMADVEIIDVQVQVFSLRASRRDKHFGAELAKIVPELSNRLARR